LSPDGTQLAVAVGGQVSDIWISDLVRPTLTRLTFDGASYPVWMPDSRRIVWFGAPGLFRQAVDGTGTIERLAERAANQLPTAVTPDGTRLVLRQDGAGTGTDLAVLALDGERGITPLLQTRSNERNAEISPDGRWLAYESDESGQPEIYVRPFPAVDAGRWQVSASGGRKPLWARSGQEIFYLALGGALVGVPVEAVGRASIRVGSARKLVEGSYDTGGPFRNRNYDVSPDGRRFLMVKESGAASQRSLVVVQNWAEELRRLVPASN
jgi:serine/threonine-protein kinase